MRSIISDCLCHANTQMSPVGIKIIITSGRNKGYFKFITRVAISEVNRANILEVCFLQH